MPDSSTLPAVAGLPENAPPLPSQRRSYYSLVRVKSTTMVEEDA